MRILREQWRWVAAVLVVAAALAVALVVSLDSRRAGLARAASGEGRLTIYSATDEPEFRQLLQSFRAAYPGIAVDYRSMTANDVYQRFRSEADAGVARADLLINSAMDLQVKLVNDGYAQSYASPEASHLPAWAVWKEQAYAVTAEPIVIAYNTRHLDAALVPRTHDDLARILHDHPAKLRGRVGLYDPEVSPVGLLYINQDLQVDRDAWDLIAALGRLDPRLFRSSREMIDAVAAGELLLAYNVIGPYAFERAARDPALGVVMPQDYTLVMSRVALIPKGAPHPAGAKLFLNFMLSRQGQLLLARHHMIPLRSEIADKGIVAPTNARAVRVGPALLANLDAMNRRRFLEKWTALIRPDETAQLPAMNLPKSRKVGESHED